LSANLPQLEKRKFGQLHAQFYEGNKIIGWSTALFVNYTFFI
jgi:hypothetical protein